MLKVAVIRAFVRRSLINHDCYTFEIDLFALRTSFLH